MSLLYPQRNNNVSQGRLDGSVPGMNSRDAQGLTAPRIVPNTIPHTYQTNPPAGFVRAVVVSDWDWENSPFMPCYFEDGSYSNVYVPAPSYDTGVGDFDPALTFNEDASLPDYSTVPHHYVRGNCVMAWYNTANKRWYSNRAFATVPVTTAPPSTLPPTTLPPTTLPPTTLPPTTLPPTTLPPTTLSPTTLPPTTLPPTTPNPTECPDDCNTGDAAYTWTQAVNEGAGGSSSGTVRGGPYSYTLWVHWTSTGGAVDPPYEFTSWTLECSNGTWTLSAGALVDTKSGGGCPVGAYYFDLGDGNSYTFTIE